MYSEALLENFSEASRLEIQAILGDKGYHSDSFVAYIETIRKHSP